jgi:hypothetical protein
LRKFREDDPFSMSKQGIVCDPNSFPVEIRLRFDRRSVHEALAGIVQADSKRPDS